MILNDKDMTFMYNNSGYTTCDFRFEGKVFTGHANCLPEDMEFWSENVGCFIAQTKAELKAMRYMRAEARKELKVLVDFQKRLECCKNYNSKSFEARRLRKEIYLYKNKIENISNSINDTELYLKDYIKGKENLYQKLRAKRTK